MKSQINQLKQLQEENKQLKESLNISEAKSDASIADLKKEYEIKIAQWTGEKNFREEGEQRKEVLFPERKRVGILTGILIIENITLLLWLLT